MAVSPEIIEASCLEMIVPTGRPILSVQPGEAISGSETELARLMHILVSNFAIDQRILHGDKKLPKGHMLGGATDVTPAVGMRTTDGVEAKFRVAHLPAWNSEWRVYEPNYWVVADFVQGDLQRSVVLLHIDDRDHMRDCCGRQLTPTQVIAGERLANFIREGSDLTARAQAWEDHIAELSKVHTLTEKAALSMGDR